MGETRPNMVGGGLGLIYFGISYERWMTHRWGVGTGFMSVMNVAADGMFAAVVPAYVAWTPVGNRHSLYTSAGVDVVVAASGEWNGPQPWFATAAVGYLLRTNSGFFLRATLRLGINQHDYLLSPLGVTLGGSF